MINFLLQGLAGIVGHGDKELPFFGFSNIVDGTDVGMVERRSSLGFMDKTFMGL